jgi:hypothetical protein
MAKEVAVVSHRNSLNSAAFSPDGTRVVSSHRIQASQVMRLSLLYAPRSDFFRLSIVKSCGTLTPHEKNV